MTVDALGLAGNRTGAEQPDYPPAAQALRRIGLQICNVPVDVYGLDVEFGRQRFLDAPLAAVMPSHQSPTGVALPLHRRIELLDWASALGAWIIEDHYDC